MCGNPHIAKEHKKRRRGFSSILYPGGIHKKIRDRKKAVFVPDVF